MLSEINRQWLEDFRSKYGRDPSVLHIGNIANNAYNNAKQLNASGFDCDVICYDYYHVMGCPEWEDAEFEGEIQDQFKPDWTSIKLNGFDRPKWFAQGRMVQCIEYLIARRRGNAKKADAYWLKLSYDNLTSIKPKGAILLEKIQRFVEHIQNLAFKLLEDKRIANYLEWRLGRAIGKKGYAEDLLLPLAASLSLFFVFLLRLIYIPGLMIRARRHFDQDADRLVREFALTFPQREDKLTVDEIALYRAVYAKWAKLLSCYDVVQAYATDTIFPLLVNKRPYVAFEHGTLRAFTLCDKPICRLTSLGYNKADHVFITNGDCLEYAQKIGVQSYSAMLHPFDENKIGAVVGNYEGLHKNYGVDYLFLCTLRHDWAIKGTDRYIRALPQLVELIGRRFRVIMTNWGMQIEDSKRLSQELGVADLIVWIEPLNKSQLSRMQKSVDILFDQIALPHFGATAPEGIAAGVPVIMSYEPESTAWIVKEPAPILSAWTEEEIAQQVKKALNPEWLADYRIRAKNWIDRHHCSSIVLNGHADVYRRLLDSVKD